MAKQKYYQLNNILKENCEYNILLGERSNGKSYAVKHFCIYDYLKNGNMFIYLRRYTVESKNMMVESYFDDVDVPKITKGKYEYISVYRGGIYFAYIDSKTDKEIRAEQIGMIMSLSISTHYKSMSLLKYKNLIFEEFISKTLYLEDEPNTLQQLVSTIARREKIKVFLIGNTISRLCPYFNEWALQHIPSQKQGTIDVYKMNTTQEDENGNPVVVHIAVELCENSGNNSKMFFGSVSKSITNGSWEVEEQPHIPYKYDECKKMYALTVIKYNMIYVCELMRHENEYFIFVHPSNKIRTDRIIQDAYSPNMLTTNKLTELTRGDKLMKYLIKLNKICYSDNLTGSEFETNIVKFL